MPSQSLFVFKQDFTALQINQVTRKMVPITGRASSVLKTNIKLNPFLYALLSQGPT